MQKNLHYNDNKYFMCKVTSFHISSAHSSNLLSFCICLTGMDFAFEGTRIVESLAVLQLRVYVFRIVNAL